MLLVLTKTICDMSVYACTNQPFWWIGGNRSGTVDRVWNFLRLTEPSHSHKASKPSVLSILGLEVWHISRCLCLPQHDALAPSPLHDIYTLQNERTVEQQRHLNSLDRCSFMVVIVSTIWHNRSCVGE